MAIKRARQLQMRETDRVIVNGKTSLGMAFKTESAQSSWLPNQMLKKSGDIWRNWRKMGLSLPLARENPMRPTALYRQLTYLQLWRRALVASQPIAEIVNATLRPRSNSAD